MLDKGTSHSNWLMEACILGNFNEAAELVIHGSE